MACPSAAVSDFELTRPEPKQLSTRYSSIENPGARYRFSLCSFLVKACALYLNHNSLFKEGLLFRHGAIARYLLDQRVFRLAMQFLRFSKLLSSFFLLSKPRVQPCEAIMRVRLRRIQLHSMFQSGNGLLIFILIGVDAAEIEVGQT